MRKDCDGNPEIAILLQFLAIEPHFMRKGCTGRLANRNFTSVFGDRTSFRAKGLHGNPEIAILLQFLAIEPHFVRNGCAGRLANRNFTSVFGISCERVAREPGNCNSTSVFGDRTSFRAKWLRRTTCKSQFYLSFWRSNLISCGRVAPDDLQIAILPQFLAIEPHFVRKGCARRIAISQFYFSFWRSNLSSCERVAFVPSRWHCPAPSREK